MKMIAIVVGAAVSGAGLAWAAAPAPADLLLTHGAIYTVNSAKPWADTVAIAKGKIV